MKSDKDANCSVVERLNIEDKGAFAWPEEFYGGELLKDTVEFLAAQAEG